MVWDDFSQTHTFKPVEIAAAGGSLPLLQLAGALGLALATALTVLTLGAAPGPGADRLKEAA